MPVIVVRFQLSLKFLHGFWTIIQYKISWKSVHGSRVASCRRIGMIKVTVAFHDVANATKKNWIHLAQDRFPSTSQSTHWCHKICKTSWLPVQAVASEEGLCRMELVTCRQDGRVLQKCNAKIASYFEKGRRSCDTNYVQWYRHLINALLPWNIAAGSLPVWYNDVHSYAPAIQQSPNDQPWFSDFCVRPNRYRNSGQLGPRVGLPVRSEVIYGGTGRVSFN